ncbi:MAG: hypothetical protein CL930_01580 [Deltaproteobacteria bacterium]|nr:hypothetical protein [Deltaproteobacteria bacterium]|tara:strand:+ start:1025 stop:1576 length:552 start_codon:yes stop_codon:yes gene_type:complete
MRFPSALYCVIFGLGCQAATTAEKQPESDEQNEGGQDTDEQRDTGEAEDTGDEPGPDPEPPAYLLPGAFVGSMDATNIYDGSLGHYEEACTGDAAFTITEDFVVEGTGNCATSWLDMGFFIEGLQEDQLVSGNLVAENETDRVETPFSGTRTDDGVELSFDATHVNEGEQLRIVGTISVVLQP